MGEFSSTTKIALVFLECVRNESATDQLAISDNMVRIMDTIFPYNLSICAEKVVWSRPDYISFSFLIPSVLSFEGTTQLEVVMHIK